MLGKQLISLAVGVKVMTEIIYGKNFSFTGFWGHGMFKDKIYLWTYHVLILYSFFTVIHFFIRYLFFLTFSFLHHSFYCCFLLSFSLLKPNTLRLEQYSNERCSDNAVLSLKKYLYQVQNMDVTIKFIKFWFYSIVSYFILWFVVYSCWLNIYVGKRFFTEFCIIKRFAK